MTNDNDQPPIPLDAIADWLARHPEVERIVITDTVEEMPGEQR